MNNLAKAPAFLILLTIFFSACKASEKTAKQTSPLEVTGVPSIAVYEGPAEEQIPEWVSKKGDYNPEKTKYFDLINTKLAVSFDWEKQHLLGKAELLLEPWFYPQDSIVLDAKGFDIHQVAVVNLSDTTALNFTYDSLQVTAFLDRKYKKGEKLQVFVDYTAKPNELPQGGSNAITSDKGLYFINPLGKEEGKPKQIWTQNETEAASCWFPTFDSPNTRTKQEIYITVDTTFKTVSNGKLIFQQNNHDGTRTDYWKQELPHAPYLFMMAVGDFAKVDDKSWRGKPVSYFVEKEFAPFAKDIFGNTPEMLDFFSDKFGYDYPWDKYYQIVVRDFVSGAMENTSASIFMEEVQVDKSYLIDEDWDGIIAHELSHHWFGDLVTCESWANLPLNEGFATYSEYLWYEHKLGVNEADLARKEELDNYLFESASKQEPLIRYQYLDKEEMFDSHSYAKASVILHLLRNHIGDEAFFAAIKNYLHQYAFQQVEIHQLRIAFEQVTGQDLNWFFDQWFLSPGHPNLHIVHSYEDGKVSVRVRQHQDVKYTKIYKLPASIDIWVNGEKERHSVLIDEAMETFEFPATSQPDLVLFDPEQVIPSEVDFLVPTAEFIFQFQHAENILARLSALNELASGVDEELITPVLFDALNDEFWKVRETAVSAFSKYAGDGKDELVKKVSQMVQSDPHPMVRAEAMNVLATLDKNKLDIAKIAMKDSSYTVVATGLYAYANMGGDQPLLLLQKFEDINDLSITVTLADFYSYYGVPNKMDWFVEKLGKGHREQTQYLLNYFGSYLLNRPVEAQLQGAKILSELALNNENINIRVAAYRALYLLSEVEGVEEILNEIMEKEPSQQAREMYQNMMIAY
ncbi:M1 family metallopeptidase [Flammeovirgaceae bacterium SG7u.111]|nr:M1 family metallopeptidase [Flammeovirgaceae bacterium SG7u.132]WPO35803.1 M1 family metallopeptidase [Flammeovirgaceae bacterium SG7u.111]